MLDSRESTEFKKVEKAEVLNILFALVINSKASCSPDTQPLELEDGDEKQNETPTNQVEVASDLLHHLHICKSMGPDGIHLRARK